MSEGRACSQILINGRDCNRSICYTTVNYINVFPILEESNGSSTPMRTGSQHSDGS